MPHIVVPAALPGAASCVPGLETPLVLAPTVEERVRRAFADAPVMIEIARCESQFRQFDEDGTVLRGRANPQDVGVFQINERYHLGAARALGYDIYTIDGNLGYARHLYNQNGTRDWGWSRRCWITPTR